MTPLPSRVALLWAGKQADLSPPLGYPGGSCYVIERIQDKVRNPRDRENLISLIEQGYPATELDAKTTARIYRDVEVERGAPGTGIKAMAITRHAQYRMDLRGIRVSTLVGFFKEFHEDWAKSKSQNGTLYRDTELAVQRAKEIERTYDGLVVRFILIDTRQGRVAQINTVFEPGEPKPKEVSRYECEAFEGWSKPDDRTQFERMFPKLAAEGATFYVRADLNPALGFPGGPCNVMERIYQEVPGSKGVKMVDQVEAGRSLSNAQANVVYDTEVETGPSGTKFKKLRITPHAQYRMDQRGVNVQDLKLFFKDFQKQWNDLRSQQSPVARGWETQIAYGEPIKWTNRFGLTVVFDLQGDTAGIVTTYWKGVNDPKAVPEDSCPFAARVAYRYAHSQRDAGLGDMIESVKDYGLKIFDMHKELVFRPVDDLMDDLFRAIAPEIVKAVGEKEIDADVEEYLEGAQEGRFEALAGYLSDPEGGKSEDYYAGYDWGFANYDSWDGRDLPSSVKRRVVQDQIKEFRGEVSERVVEDLLKKAWSAVSPAHTLHAMKAAVKKHGWKLGLGFAVFEIVEHMILPTVMIKLTGHPEMAVLGTIPIGELIYAIGLRILGSKGKKIEDADGYLDWYQSEYGPVRLAYVS